MAHAGKHYPLHLRRDLCLGCRNHERSLGRTYILNLNVINSGLGLSVYNFSNLTLHAFEEATFPLAKWEAAEILNGGYTWDWLMEVYDWDYAAQITKIRMSIWVDGTLALVFTSQFLFPESATQIQTEFNVWTRTFRNPTVIPGASCALGGGGSAAGW